MPWFSFLLTEDSAYILRFLSMSVKFNSALRCLSDLFRIENGTDSIIFVLIRGASAGTMHVVSGLIGGVGLAFAKRFKPVMIVGTITVLTVSVTFHGMYNLLVSARGVLMYIGFAMPHPFRLPCFWFLL